MSQFINEPIYQSINHWYNPRNHWYAARNHWYAARVWAPPLKGGWGDVISEGMLYKEWGCFYKNRQINKSANRQIISQTQAYSLPKTSPKTHTHQR